MRCSSPTSYVAPTSEGDRPIRSAAGWGLVREGQGAQAGAEQSDDLLRAGVGEAAVLEQVPGDDDADGFVDLFAPDGVIELPFAGPGMPSRLAGQEAIRDYSHRMDASPLRIDDLEATALYHTEDPEVVIIELATRGTVTSTGRVFEGTSIQVFRIRDGKIVYFNVPGLQDLLAV
jgi:uncharacterized protein